MCAGENCVHTSCLSTTDSLSSVWCLVSTTDTAAIVFPLQQHLCVLCVQENSVHIIQLKRWVQLSQLTSEEGLVSRKTREDLILSSRLLLHICSQGPIYWRLSNAMQCNGDSPLESNLNILGRKGLIFLIQPNLQCS